MQGQILRSWWSPHHVATHACLPKAKAARLHHALLPSGAAQRLGPRGAPAVQWPAANMLLGRPQNNNALIAARKVLGLLLRAACRQRLQAHQTLLPAQLQQASLQRCTMPSANTGQKQPDLSGLRECLPTSSEETCYWPMQRQAWGSGPALGLTHMTSSLMVLFLLLSDRVTKKGQVM